LALTICGYDSVFEARKGVGNSLKEIGEPKVGTDE
jgi:hypothetical protein